MAPMFPTNDDPLDGVTAAPGSVGCCWKTTWSVFWYTVFPADQTVPLHTHSWASVLYVISWSDFVRRDADGVVMVHSRESVALAPGTAIWSGPLPAHTLGNVGEQELRVIAVEQKVRAAA